MGQKYVEINPRAFWRLTFDNLDFIMKFAKKISVGGHLKRMLHLLISQISFRPKCTNSFNDKTPSINDKDLK